MEDTLPSGRMVWYTSICMIPSTVHIFERLVRDMPPLVPANVKQDARQALEQVKNNVHLGIDELEDTMITFGMKLWPYREAFLEFFRVYEGEMGEKFLSQKMTREMKKKYQEFKEGGGSFADLFVGSGPIYMFAPHERAQLCKALVEVQHEIWQFAAQSVVTRDRKKYEQRIGEFKEIFGDIAQRLEDLRGMAEKESEHPELASEMREHVRGFEHGLCLLGPKLDYAAVCNTVDHFDSRHEQRKLHRVV